MKNPASNAVNGHLLNRAVLVLNANYSPLMVCTAKRAICLDYLDKVDVLVNYDEKIYSPSMSYDLPSVIKIKHYIRYENMSMDLNRKNILARDNHTCQYCNANRIALTIDHIIPKKRGGSDTWENLVAACQPCNQKKGGLTLKESNMVLNRIPKRPNRLHYFQRYVKDHQMNWKPFLFMEPFKIN